MQKEKVRKLGRPKLSAIAIRIEKYIKQEPDWFINSLDDRVCNKFNIDFDKFNRHFEKVSGLSYGTYLKEEAIRRLTLEYGSLKDALEQAKFYDNN